MADASVATEGKAMSGGTPFHDAEAKRKVANRLKRAQGQLAAVIDAVESEAGCREVVQQLSAVSKAIDRAGFLIISTALRECLTDPDGGAEEQREELEKLFLTLA
ncbi:metal-sensitive transcriptional regulator [Leucobacter sp. CSA2]|uniref:Metal-sensitive transcriptional regulator n=1 Tax=Leucobacter edaphi TaxID=2796472 RepID=A0A934QEL8_9MICO|nr:metal-sensitive transcriptional regulator [Leucobacter edaphi]MBK0422581.1 metal-sensitive transcriptional regulator [Leucobacter edaphi]